MTSYTIEVRTIMNLQAEKAALEYLLSSPLSWLGQYENIDPNNMYVVQDFLAYLSIKAARIVAFNEEMRKSGNPDEAMLAAGWQGESTRHALSNVYPPSDIQGEIR